ncbi:PRK06851 family protein [Lederbergia lenta]|uniref:Putative nucleotide kinase n=1 Tax=Lederbergia lenta TaxID=1467 RepID=A0A2X4ZEY1_LEDLE|nr:PRK06851 family protein [Lederbergia lenta]MEC2323304.1 PRK06851 family protein [Lederbergia lenta]SQI63165.1 putative nucleotide kinase [Lederbergia lenta]
MGTRILRYFAGGNTTQGFYNLYDSNLADLDRVFILSGKSSREKSYIIEQLLEKWTEAGYTIEVIHRANDYQRLEGLIIRTLSFAVIDGDLPRTIGKEYVGSHWETIDMDQASRTANLDKSENEISELIEKMEVAFDKAYQAYAEGLRVHDDWERIYINQMDFEKANETIHKSIADLFPETKTCQRESDTKHRFLGAATPEGPIDYVDNITEELKARYFLKGRAGTGKSTFLRKIVQEAKLRGYDIEVYHCGFDPESLDMVVVRALGWAIFDSTKPHEYFPSRPGDEIIDMYELTIAPGTDETFATEIAKIESAYRKHMDAGKKYLAEAKVYQDELEEIYAEVTNHSYLAQILSEMDDELQELASEHK